MIKEKKQKDISGKQSISSIEHNRRNSAECTRQQISPLSQKVKDRAQKVESGSETLKNKDRAEGQTMKQRKAKFDELMNYNPD